MGIGFARQVWFWLATAVAIVVALSLLHGILLPFVAALIDRLPGYVAKLQTLLTDPNRPWLSKIVGEGFADATKSTGDLVRQGVGWLATFLRSLWSGGQAVISFLSLAVVTPVVAFYLICDWHLASRVYIGAPSELPGARVIADAGPKLGPP